ncbi:MAG TPA: fused MFS/spermidine synthase, partial [Candidatus Nanoarchaeia archaeon]|nr:fused MFS/spermidine synthase [Candidatus Nanoarchaeia archaeon]
MKEAMLFFAAFVTGALVMMLEILGFRMFAPYFGYSIYVSGMLIGIVLMALSIGAYLGGFLADRKPEPRPLIEILLITDLYLFAIAYFYDRILQWLGSLAAIPG